MKTKLTVKKPNAETLQTIDTCEKKLDLFNLLLIRQRVDLEVEKSGKLEAEQAQKKGSWFSWWGGKQDNGENENKDKDICINIV